MRLKTLLLCAFAASTSALAAGAFADTATYRYDALGRVVVVINPDGTQQTYTYDQAGNRVQTVVGGTNLPPTAGLDAKTTAENTALTFDPRTNDSDPTGETLSITAVSVPKNGTASVAGGGTQITYTPATNFSGADTFTYSLSDGTNTVVGTVNVTVTSTNTAPDAVNDQRTVQKSTALTFDPRVNDTDANADTISITGASGATRATLSFNATSITYTPTSTYTGGDSFTYSISDGRGGTDTATVTITLNAPPTAGTDLRTTVLNTSTTFDPRTNDVDTDGGTLAVAGVSTAGHGTTSYTASSITYTPMSGYSGPDAFTYTLSDGQGGAASGSVQVTVTSTNTPPNAVNDGPITAQKNTALTFDPRTNDTDSDGGTLAVTAVSTPGHGMASYTGTSITYTPTTGYTGADSLTYTLSDGQGGTDTATVSIVVNAPPTAAADSPSTTTNTAVTFDPRANDTDSDGGSLTVTGVSAASNGTTAYTGTSVTYTPSTGFAGSDSFTYTLSDGQGATATGTVNVTVSSAPVDGTVLYTKSTAGSFSYTIPAGVTQVDIEGWGAGADGRVSEVFGDYVPIGGSGGGYFKKRITVTQGQTISGNVASGPGTQTTVTGQSLTANSPTATASQGATASGGDVNTPGNGCCQGLGWEGGGAGNGGGDATDQDQNGTAPGGGGAGGMGVRAPGQIKITARTN